MQTAQHSRLGSWFWYILSFVLVAALAIGITWPVVNPWLGPWLVAHLGAPPTSVVAPTPASAPPVNAQGTLNGAAQTAGDRGVYMPAQDKQVEATPVPMSEQPTGAPVVAPQPAGEKQAQEGARSRSAERSEVGAWYKAGPAVAAPAAQGKSFTLDRDGAAVGVGKGMRP